MASNSPWHRLYNTARWKRLRAQQLALEPLCREHRQSQGRTVPAAIVDHIEAHKGDEIKFFDPRNLQSLCKQCHDSHKQRLERSGSIIGCDIDGNPLNKNHSWLNK